MRLTLALFFVALTAAAQTPEVPHKMEFAGMTLTIRDDARREIQKDVNALTQSPRHHMIKVERARTYFPLIEKVFAEEQVPDDFKYLVLQESALIADAVSVSNAVGFWQFKDFTAVEMGLRVDKVIDERLNIISSTRAAGRYIKKNNTFFDNWVYALQAYQMGAGGVMRSVSKDQHGKKSMEITSNTYWYVKKFLAHKIAFEATVGAPGQIKVVPFVNSADKDLKDLAREVSVDELELMNYNKWAKRGTIPGDRQYTVLIPMKGDGVPPELPSQPVASTVAVPATTTAAKTATVSALKGRTKINGISAIRPEPNETAAALATRAGVELNDFVKWNDISSRDQLQQDTYYLLGKKRARASVNYHTALAGDDLWKVSQRYGVQLRKLKRYNRMSGNDELTAGTTVWLSSMKPKNAPATSVAKGPVAQVEDENSFAWTVDPASTSGAVAAGVATGTAVKGGSNEQKLANSKMDNAPAEKTTSSSAQVATLEETAVTEGLAEQKGLEEDQTPNATSTGEPETSTTSTTGSGTLAGDAPSSTTQRVDTPGTAPTVTKETTTVATTGSVAGATTAGAPLIPPGSEQNTVVTTTVTPLNSVEEAKTSPGPMTKGKETHTVKTGETLYGISHEYGVAVMDLVEWNGLVLQEGIKPGQVLKLRSPEDQATASVAVANETTIEHIVRSTDTLYSVARKYNVTIKELMDWNHKKDFNLAIGEKLIVKGR
ncbi:LysM peptidoglycan-binding domain-containing protein [Chryseolinea sp. T2]|uniref:LysM peptidoglycan-binding domain-containing protein n=1 Tax=Chryseolinea sp. T2 TaxID=3129255 RepID=UPI003077C8F3